MLFLNVPMQTAGLGKACDTLTTFEGTFYSRFVKPPFPVLPISEFSVPCPDLPKMLSNQGANFCL